MKKCFKKTRWSNCERMPTLHGLPVRTSRDLKKKPRLRKEPGRYVFDSISVSAFTVNGAFLQPDTDQLICAKPAPSPSVSC